VATSGTFTGSRGGGSTGPWLTLDWSLLQQDIANNKSQLRLTLTLHSDYYINFSSSKTGDLEGNSFTYTAGMSGTGTRTLKTLDLWYTHASDGSLTTTLSGSFNIAISWGGSTVSSLSVSGSASPTTIPRASDFTAFTLSNSVLNKDTAFTVNYTLNRKSTAFSQDMSLNLGSKVIKSWNTTGTGALTQALTTTEVNTILSSTPNATSGTLTLTMQTKSGTTKIGSLISKTASFTLNSAIVPTATGLAVSIYGSGRDKTIAKYVQNVTKVTASFTGTAGYGATESSNTIVVRRQSDDANSQTITGESGTTGNPVALSGVYEVIATTKDSRGRTATQTVTFTVDAYTPPTITTFTAARDATTSTAVKLTYNTSWSVIGTTLNPTDVSVVGVNNVGTSATLYTLTGSNAGNVNSSTTPTGQSDSSRYTYTLTVTDSFGNKAVATATVSTSFVEFTVSKGYGIGVGKVWEAGALDVAGRTYIRNKSGGTVFSVNDESYVAGTTGMYNYWGFCDGNGAYQAYLGFSSSRDNVLNIVNNIGGIKLTPKSGEEIDMVGVLNMNNSNIIGVNSLHINDIGGDEGLIWDSASGTNNWKIVVTDDAATGNTDTTAYPLQWYLNDSRRMTLGTGGMLYLPQTTGGVKLGDYDTGNGTLIGATGNIELRAASGSAYVDFTNDTGDYDMRIMRTGDDVLTVSGGNLAATVVAPSKEEWKEDIQEFVKSGLDIINGSKPKTYKYKNTNAKETKIGLIAEEAPDDILTINKDGVDLYSMLTVSWKAIQELSAQVEYLTKKLKDK
jgi:hypothetical protein